MEHLLNVATYIEGFERCVIRKPAFEARGMEDGMMACPSNLHMRYVDQYVQIGEDVIDTDPVSEYLPQHIILSRDDNAPIVMDIRDDNLNNSLVFYDNVNNEHEYVINTIEEILAIKYVGRDFVIYHNGTTMISPTYNPQLQEIVNSVPHIASVVVDRDLMHVIGAPETSITIDINSLQQWPLDFDLLTPDEAPVFVCLYRHGLVVIVSSNGSVYTSYLDDPRTTVVCEASDESVDEVKVVRNVIVTLSGSVARSVSLMDGEVKLLNDVVSIGGVVLRGEQRRSVKSAIQ